MTELKCPLCGWTAKDELVEYVMTLDDAHVKINCTNHECPVQSFTTTFWPRGYLGTYPMVEWGAEHFSQKKGEYAGKYVDWLNARREKDQIIVPLKEVEQ